MVLLDATDLLLQHFDLVLELLNVTLADRGGRVDGQKRSRFILDAVQVEVYINQGMLFRLLWGPVVSADQLSTALTLVLLGHGLHASHG